MSCTYQSSILHEIKMRIFISRRSSPPHGHDLHQHQRAGDAEDEFTHLCDLIDFAAEMNFKLDDINKHSFNEFQLRCSVLIAGILQLEYWLKPIIIIIINQDRNCCRSSCLRRNRSHKTSVWHLGRYSELFYIFIFVHHTFIYYILWHQGKYGELFFSFVTTLTVFWPNYVIISWFGLKMRFYIFYRVSQKNALSESSSCKQQPRGDQIQDVLNMISPRLLLAGWWFWKCVFLGHPVDQKVKWYSNIQHDFNNLFVWEWKECKSPRFLFRFYRNPNSHSCLCSCSQMQLREAHV